MEGYRKLPNGPEIGDFRRYDFNWAAAEQYYQRAIMLNPGAVSPRHQLAMNVLCPLGRIDEALAQCDRARPISTRSPWPSK